MGSPSAYRDETFVFATMHAKERAVARPFSRWLGAAVTVAPGIDTDAFGTFTGEIVRQGTMLDAARAKALAAIKATGLELGLGSEGSFGPHPAVPFIASGTEVLLCQDRKRGLEIHEMVVTDRTNYQSFACRPGEDITFPLASLAGRCRDIQSTGRSPENRQGNNFCDQTCRGHRACGFRIARRACARRNGHAGSPQSDANGLNPGFGNPPRAASCDALSGLRRSRIWSGGRLARIALRLVRRADSRGHGGTSSLRDMRI